MIVDVRLVLLHDFHDEPIGLFAGEPRLGDGLGNFAGETQTQAAGVIQPAALAAGTAGNPTAKHNRADG